MNRPPSRAKSLRCTLRWVGVAVFAMIALGSEPAGLAIEHLNLERSVGNARSRGCTSAASTSKRYTSSQNALASTTVPSTAPATAPSEFQDPAGLLRIEYPADWQVHPDPDYVLSLVSGPQTFTLDIPDLPPHIPGMIPLGLVVNGYKDDLRKSHAGVKIDEETPPAIPKARSRRLRSSWSEKNVSVAEIATLIVHGDHVFILRIVMPADQLSAARNDYNRIIDSLRWLK